MSLFSSLYGAGVRVRNQLYDRQVLRSKRLRGPVICVGSLSAGGAGKTPMVLCLGELLKERGISFDILSRGYGRRSRGVLQVNPAGAAQEFGDEPLLMARQLQVPVIVGESRVEAGTFAEEKFGEQLHLLDDGFQHRELARDFEIVLLTPEDLADQLLPAGHLREPLSALSRADAVVWNGDDMPALPEIDQGKIWRITRGIRLETVSTRPLAFCGIARPHNFFAQLKASGIELAAEAIYRDHHQYSDRDVTDLLRLREQKGGNGFITTEKDAVNLGDLIAQFDPIAVVPLRVRLENAANALDTMLYTIRERRQKA